RARIAGVGATPDIVFDVRYDEGAAVGYRWYDQGGRGPLFPFGHGLSYTTFKRAGLTAAVESADLRVAFSVTNTGTRRGHDVAQVYLSPVAGGWECSKLRGAFTRLELAPGESRAVALAVEPRLLAVWDGAKHAFRVAA